MVNSQTAYRRVLLKLSGEVMMGSGSYGIDSKTVENMAKELFDVHNSGVELAIVIGGGNIFRGLDSCAANMDRTSADYMGMLATVMNAIALQDAMEKLGLDVRVLSALTIKEVSEPYIRRRAVRHLEKRRVVIFAAGTGNPYFTTDTAASLRAMEIQADVVLKGTKVDGIYDSDPVKNPDAVRYDQVTFTEALNKQLQVMDATAFSLCRDNNMPILVFSILEPGNLQKAIAGENVGTLVQE